MRTQKWAIINKTQDSVKIEGRGKSLDAFKCLQHKYVPDMCKRLKDLGVDDTEIAELSRDITVSMARKFLDDSIEQKVLEETIVGHLRTLRPNYTSGKKFKLAMETMNFNEQFEAQFSELNKNLTVHGFPINIGKVGADRIISTCIVIARS